MVLRSFPEGSKTRTAERPLSATTTLSSLSTAMSIGSLYADRVVEKLVSSHDVIISSYDYDLVQYGGSSVA